VAALESSGLVEHVAARLAVEGLAADGLAVEVTEGAMSDQGAATATLDALRGLGIQVAVDDFGAGYSSLGRLGTLPVDRLKLDRSLLAAAERHASEQAFLRAMTTLGASLGLPVVAEGVETARQLELLRGAGCAWVQGYLFARPMPGEQVLGWLHGWSTQGSVERAREA
jgi:EAL domain-containing protein (putative c-di-GMP-specific phosphodiesterase class I)